MYGSVRGVLRHLVVAEPSIQFPIVIYSLTTFLIPEAAFSSLTLQKYKP